MSLDFSHLQARIQKPTTKANSERWKMIIEEVSKYYGKPLYWLPFKFSISIIEFEFLKLEKEKDKNFTHLMQRLNESKKR